MPHVIVKMHLGRSEQQKAQLAESDSERVMAVANGWRESSLSSY
jgi:phenylpyruvate tautomerase PptA (4-oxalocrotonate tautomerase family)